VAASGAAVGIGLAIGQRAATGASSGTQPSSGAAPAAVAPPAPSGPSLEPPAVPAAGWFHIVVNGERQGPLDPAALRQRAREGTITAETLVWRPGMERWTPASQVPEVAELLR
jgi:hypothetical protein